MDKVSTKVPTKKGDYWVKNEDHGIGHDIRITKGPITLRKVGQDLPLLVENHTNSDETVQPNQVLGTMIRPSAKLL